MARSPKSNRTRKSRKPVTIDLEAQEVQAPEDVSVTDDAASSQPEAEPVAFENVGSAAQPIEDSDDVAADEASTESTEPSEDNSEKASIAAAPPPPPASGGNRTSALTGGLIGGLLALLGGAGLQWAGVLPNPGGGNDPAPAVDLAPLQAEIAALKTQLENVQSESTAQVAAMPEDVSQAIEAANSSAQQALAEITDVKTNLSGLGEKITSIETAVSSGGAGENAGLETLAARLSDIETRVETGLAAAPNLEELDLTVVMAPTNEKLDALDSQVSALTSDFDAFKGTVDERLSGINSQLADGGSDASVAAAIAAAGLKSAIDRGGSFMRELEAYATVAPDAEVVAELRNYAAAGVPTINQLSDSFSSVANRIVATGQGLPEDAGIADRLMASARSLVQIRPKGQVEGDTPGAIAARVEQRLLESDLEGAIAEFETLPDAAKETAAQFGENMRARRAVDLLVGQALTGAMASTAPSSN